uniref:Uncharacterized protein n=1 Tax=Anopheles arabiensis TaxID=7173 RepID=A0A182IG07_ANOAR
FSLRDSCWPRWNVFTTCISFESSAGGAAPHAVWQGRGRRRRLILVAFRLYMYVSSVIIQKCFVTSGNENSTKNNIYNVDGKQRNEEKGTYKYRPIRTGYCWPGPIRSCMLGHTISMQWLVACSPIIRSLGIMQVNGIA